MTPRLILPRLILNADDLGLAAPVNAAIERAHRDGVLTAASLMVGEPRRGRGRRRSPAATRASPSACT